MLKCIICMLFNATQLQMIVVHIGGLQLLSMMI